MNDGNQSRSKGWQRSIAFLVAQLSFVLVFRLAMEVDDFIVRKSHYGLRGGKRLGAFGSGTSSIDVNGKRMVLARDAFRLGA